MGKGIVLVTGAGGWLGTELTLQLLRQGKRVRAFNKIETDSLKKLKEQFKDDLEIVLGDITVPDQINEAMKDVKEVYHLAAKVHFIPTNKREEEEFYTINTEATRQLFEYCKQYKVERVIFFSSVSVFEKSENLISQNSKKSPETIYGKSKLEAEKIGEMYFKKYNLPITIIEPVTVYGEGDVGNFAKLEKMIKRGFLVSFGKQKNKKTVIYYKDLISMVLEIAKDKSSIGKNIICGTETIEVNEIYKILMKKANRKILHIQIPMWMANLGIKICCFSVLKKIRRKIQALTANNEFELLNCKEYLTNNFMTFEKFELSKNTANKKVLFVATVTGHINAFHIPYLKWFKEKGYEVHVASNGEENIEYCDKHFNIPFERFPIKPGNIKAYKQLKSIINNNQYEIIHCHTPVGGVLTRLAARKARKKYHTRVIYTAHGFHFYKGAPLLNWIIYYPIEKWLSKYTDCLITINEEDYQRAKNKFKRAKQIELVHGVGVDSRRYTIKFNEKEKEKLKESIGINNDDIVLTYVAELNDNKNQILLIDTLEELIKVDKRYKLLLVGDGINKENYIEEVTKRQLSENVKIMGRRNDVPQILSITNIYLASSIREGLGLNIVEAMFMKIPVIATDNRGHRELVKDNYRLPNNKNIWKNKILNFNSNDKYEYKNNMNLYEIENVLKEMEEIYINE